MWEMYTVSISKHPQVYYHSSIFIFNEVKLRYTKKWFSSQAYAQAMEEHVHTQDICVAFSETSLEWFLKDSK